MKKPMLNRRGLILSGACLMAIFASPLVADPQRAIHVMKGTGCECCTAWVEKMQAEGFTVTSEELYGMLLINYKRDNGIPAKLISCHTGMIDGYMIEGHVPAVDIRRLLDERPDAVGLAVPGMPYGSPGMGEEANREAYDVLLIQRDGTTQIYSSYPAA